MATYKKLLHSGDNVSELTNNSNYLTSVPNHSASLVTSGTLSTSRIPNISASKITSGTLPVSRGGTGSTSASGARTNLGLGTSSSVTFTNITAYADATIDGALNIEGDANLNSEMNVSGGSISEYYRKVDWQWSCNWYTRYGYYYYPNTTYGVNNQDWSTGSSNAKTSWTASHVPPFVVPYDFKIKECYLRGFSTSSQTFELILKKGTPNWNNSSASTTIANITSGSALETVSCTLYRKNEIGSSSLNVSVSKGDILVPQLRRTTNTSSASYSYFRGVFSIVGEKKI